MVLRHGETSSFTGTEEAPILLDINIVLCYIIAIHPRTTEAQVADETKTGRRVKAASNQFNTRLPQLTHQQINGLSRDHGLTKTQVIIVAVDRLSRELTVESTEASKDVRRLKTAARIAPHLDLGQDD